MKSAKLGCVLVALCTAAGGHAQDIGAEPTTGAIVLEAGFPTDPTTATVFSGGDIDASATIEGCSGYISERPDLRLTFTADPTPSAMPLFIHALSDGDTTLLIHAPDGNWYCNDDGANGINPMLVFGPAMSGYYQIWLGSYEVDQNHEALVAFSELGADLGTLQTPVNESPGR
ncbi:MAG: peptidase S1 [Pseudomonadota bacterium]